MATMYIDHHRDDVSRLGYADVVGKYKHLLEGESSPSRIDPFERSRQMPSDTCDNSSASSVVEVRRCEVLRASGEREPLAYQERNEDPIIEKERSSGQGRDRR